MKNKIKKHKKTQLRNVLGSDLLTAREKIIKGEMGGLYALTDELAYCAGHDDKAQMTLKEFETKLRDEIDPNFCVVYNPTITANHAVEGHSIYLYLPSWDSYIPLCKVGRSASSLISANSIGQVVEYRGASYKSSGALDQEAILSRGWVAAYEACRLAYEDMERNGVEPSRAISIKEANALKQMYTVNIGGKDTIKSFIERATIDKFINELAHREGNLVYLEDPIMYKFINKIDSNQIMFMDVKEYSELTDKKEEELYSIWRKLEEKEVNEMIGKMKKDAEDIKLELKETKEEQEK